MEPKENQVTKHEDSQNQVYQSVRGFVIEARQQVYKSVNTAMVLAYWKIGKTIYETDLCYGLTMMAKNHIWKPQESTPLPLRKQL